jgi:hypothetical protein
MCTQFNKLFSHLILKQIVKDIKIKSSKTEINQLSNQLLSKLLIIINFYSKYFKLNLLDTRKDFTSIILIDNYQNGRAIRNHN